MSKSGDMYIEIQEQRALDGEYEECLEPDSDKYQQTKTDTKIRRNKMPKLLIKNKHELECSQAIKKAVSEWLNKNVEQMQLLLWDFQDECQNNLQFPYNKSQFRCWVWDEVINPKKEK